MIVSLKDVKMVRRGLRLEKNQNINWHVSTGLMVSGIDHILCASESMFDSEILHTRNDILTDTLDIQSYATQNYVLHSSTTNIDTT